MGFGPVGMRGWGALPPGDGVNPDAVNPPSAPDFKQAIDDIHRIAQKYDGPPVENVQPFNIAAGQIITIDYSQTPHSAIIVNVETGTLKVWQGTQPNASSVGHLTFPSGGPPVQLVFSTNGRYYSLGNDPLAATNVTGCFWIERL